MKHFPFVVAGIGFVIVTAHGGVAINEFMAASSDRRLFWSNNNVPHLGSGVTWMSPDYSDDTWNLGSLPAGYGSTGLATDLTATMKNQAPSLYLRRNFTITAAQAATANTLVLQVEYNDGFVAYLNGREVARANCGPNNHFIYASQPAYNVSTVSNAVQFSIGPASNWLVAGQNVLAIQAHNAEKPSTVSIPEQITQHILTDEFKINAGLFWVSNSVPTDLISLGSGGGFWRYFVGRYEPSGGVVDEGLVTNNFTPPLGAEGDFDQPAAFVDWVELHNNDASPANLTGWSLSDNPDSPGKWHFPTNTIIPANSYLLVLCDDRDEANAPAGPARRLHSNFKLSQQGEYLALFDSSGSFMDGISPQFPPQVFFCSYGRNPTNPAVFGFLETATPGTNNTGAFYSAQVDPPQFKDNANADLPGGIYQTPSLTLQLVSSLPGSTVRYTLDGSEPTPANGFVYTNALQLTQANDKTGVVVRARAFLSGRLPSAVQTHTYILKQPSAITNVPTLILTGEAGETFYAPHGVLAIVGGAFVPVISGSIWMANGPADYDRALGNGYPFESPAFIEYYFPPSYYPSNQVPLRDDVGLRVSGSNYQRPRMSLQGVATNSPWQPWWNSFEKPSFNVYFNGDYGSSPVEYPFFTNYPVAEFKHLRLRAGKNDLANPFITDELVRRLWIDMEHVGSRGLLCSLYINAIYKGIFNLAERIREPFFQAHYNSTASWDVDYSWEWVDGDSIAMSKLISTLSSNITVAATWQSVTNQMDVDNAADYYLLNIYSAMWDWPGNNFVIARERSAGANSRFRFAVWDAEGGFNVNDYYNKPASYNTISNDLLVATANWNYLPYIFGRLVTSPEFKLRFADRVNLNMFNGGVLDDRDPDGAGPLKSHFSQRLGELVAEAAPLVQYNTGSSLNTSAFDGWVDTNFGRRSYLLGTTDGRRMLRDNGLWPLTEPPLFSQYGGTIPANYPLTMTSTVATDGQTATIFYTLNGSDPRLFGGALNSSASTYTNTISLSQISTVKARARNNTTGEWSPLTAAIFVVAAVPASSNNLVVAEIMYHPPDASPAELAAGFSNADDFEFIRLLNIGNSPIDLSAVQFATGITFNFGSGAITYLPSESHVLIVKSLVAFQLRYGHAYDAIIAGEYGGNLSNSGEALQLQAGGVTIRNFAYDDEGLWPTAPDGDGPSLILQNPRSNPDPALATNWMASAIPGGLPGGFAPTQTFSTWRALFWDSASSVTNDTISGPYADPDGDGLNNLLEYAYGLNPLVPQPKPQITAAIENVNSDAHLVITIQLSGGAGDITVTPQTSSDLSAWSDGSPFLQLLQTTSGEDGRTVYKYFDTSRIGTVGQRFVRFQINASLL